MFVGVLFAMLSNVAINFLVHIIVQVFMKNKFLYVKFLNYRVCALTILIALANCPLKMEHQNIFLLTMYGSANVPLSSPTLEINHFFYSLPI